MFSEIQNPINKKKPNTKNKFALNILLFNISHAENIPKRNYIL